MSKLVWVLFALVVSCRTTTDAANEKSALASAGSGQQCHNFSGKYSGKCTGSQPGVGGPTSDFTLLQTDCESVQFANQAGIVAIDNSWQDINGIGVRAHFENQGNVLKLDFRLMNVSVTNDTSYTFTNKANSAVDVSRVTLRSALGDTETLETCQFGLKDSSSGSASQCGDLTVLNCPVGYIGKQLPNCPPGRGACVSLKDSSSGSASQCGDLTVLNCPVGYIEKQLPNCPPGRGACVKI